MSEQVGARIKEARTSAGMTQKQLAEAAGNISASNVSKVERGVREPSDDELVAIAKATGTDLETLLGVAQDDAPAAPEEAAAPAAEGAADPMAELVGKLGGLVSGAKDGSIPVDAVVGLISGLAGGTKEEPQEEKTPVDAVMGLISGLAGK